MFLKHFFCSCAILGEELMSRFDFNTFDDFQFGCCISCNFCPMRMNSFFFCFPSQGSGKQSTSRQNITSTTLCLVGWVKRTLSVALPGETVFEFLPFSGASLIPPP